MVDRPCLLGRFLSPYVRRVAVTMNFYEMPFDRQIISAVGDEAARERANPVGRVPALILSEDETLVDSAAILDHLDECAGPERALTPPVGPERRRALYRLAIATGAIDRAMTANAERRRDHPEPERLARLLRQSTQGFAALENDLADRPYFDGDRIGQPDVTTGIGLTFVEHVFPGTLSQAVLPGLFGLTERLEALPAFMAAKID